MIFRYIEEKNSANVYRQNYLHSVQQLVAQKLAECSDTRIERASMILQNPDRARREFCGMLGWPLTEAVSSPLSVERQLLKEENGVRLYRMKFEIFENFHFYGLYLEHTGEKLPFVVVQHGYGGTSEQCTGLFEEGTSIYNNMVQRVAAKKVHAFAPQLLMWFPDCYGIEHDRVVLDAKLKQIGGSVTALEIYCLRCCLTYFESLDCIDAERMGMAGLSYGGYFTLYTMALDTRLKTALSVCYFGDRTQHIFPDWAMEKAAKSYLDSEVALLCCPRRLWLALGSRDTAITPDSGEREYERLKCELERSGRDDSWVSLTVFDGDHEFCPDDTLLDAFISELNNKR